MKSTSDDIRQWLHKQPNWLQDATERLLKQDSLSPTDVKDLVACLRTAEGQKVTVHRAFESPRVSWRPVGLSQTDMTA